MMPDLVAQLNALLTEAQDSLQKATTADHLLRVEKQYLGRSGTLAKIVEGIPGLSNEAKKEAGKTANMVKQQLAKVVEERRAALSTKSDVVSPLLLELPGSETSMGSKHPLTTMRETIEDIFLAMGYDILYGPEIEIAKYNFDALRIPENHPARDVWDTFYVESDGSAKGPKTPLLRTHISPMQVRVMEERKPPIRFISPGRVFRHEATDATHEANYWYCEGMAIDKGLTFGDLLGTLESFFKQLFGHDVELRAQPSYFPFVEPGAEILMKGSKGWMEMLGCGMIHPDVLRTMRVDPTVYSGFAFGLGLDRITMYRNDVRDIRLSYGGDLRFLKQF